MEIIGNLTGGVSLKQHTIKVKSSHKKKSKKRQAMLMRDDQNFDLLHLTQTEMMGDKINFPDDDPILR
jgi:hypothetical protein